MTNIPVGVRIALHVRAHNCCEGCGAPGATNAHHRKNQSQGGPDTLDNLLLLDGSGTTGCHGWATTHPHEARELGWSVAASGQPALVPVARFSREHGRRVWTLLDDDGGLTFIQNAAPGAVISEP